MKTINPATGKVIKEYSEMSFEEVSGIIYRANIAQKQWKERSFTNRSVNLNKICLLYTSPSPRD